MPMRERPPDFHPDPVAGVDTVIHLHSQRVQVLPDQGVHSRRSRLQGQFPLPFLTLDVTDFPDQRGEAPVQRGHMAVQVQQQTGELPGRDSDLRNGYLRLGNPRP